MSSIPQPLAAGQARKLQRAQGLLRGGDAAQALAIAREVVAEAPRAPDAHQMLALCLAESGQLRHAESAFQRALRLAPNHPMILANLATLLRKAERYDEALQTLRTVVNKAPRFPQAWADLGRVALRLGDSAQACTALEQAVRLKPDSVAGWHALGRARRAAGELEAAETAFRKVIDLAPNNAVAWLSLGATLRLLGRSVEALECYDRSRAAGYSGPDLDDARVGALLDIGRSRDALEQARNLARNHPQFPGGHATLAHLLWEYGPALAPDEDPLASFRQALSRHPDDRPLQIAFARFLLEARRGEEAFAQLQALRDQDDHPMLMTLQANALEILGRSDQAGQLYQRVHQTLGQSDAAFLCAYTRYLLKAGRWEEARDRAADAVRIAPLDQEAWAYLGTAWRLLDDQREFWLCDYEKVITLLEVPPPPEFQDTVSFLEALRATLEPMHQAKREPVQQSLRGGSQTPGRLFGRPDPVILASQKTLTAAIERWLATLPADDRHPFLLRKAPSIRYTGSWSVKLWSSGRHVNHIHPQGWISSAFYVALPPAVRAQADQDGYIQFGQPPDELGLNLEPRRVIRPEPGRLALFPSYMWHGTVPFEDDEPRITIAFDMTPRG